MATAARISELRAMLKRVETAPDAGALGALYAELIGHDPTQEGESGADELRETLRDYVAEICYAEGIHCSEVFREWE